ncbi:alpha/beta family hydrolase [Modicisalibacter xianhensis]|uniref:KANL3/Tex30 alpha/beta hydrolase-like domain-containing protein n=1 Tax=Modicisalibacter xianhensis TaxID=442341 RepID=A0A1I3DXD5_9GAMM|nr:alpha/beta family hydrolase [Halomonas xianhensis]SFH91414.1 hypothetical protein SAMN04487959_11279 [Halomonas xianhensis]
MPYSEQNGWRQVTVEDMTEALHDDQDSRLFIEQIGPLEKRGEPRAGRLLLAHGAGAGQDSSFMRTLVDCLVENGVQTLTLEFSYMQRMRCENRRRPPPGIERLVDEMIEWCGILSQRNLPGLWLGGKSMGGRVASLVATRQEVVGLILCGYPFHPPGKPEKTRLAHWPQIACPALVLQGTRDPFGTRDEVEDYALDDNVHVTFIEDGDHDWKPRKASGLTQRELIGQGAADIATFMAASR